MGLFILKQGITGAITKILIRLNCINPLVSGREGGSGLGLTLAQTYVQQHLGLIECDSEPGRTVFKIVIPLP